MPNIIESFFSFGLSINIINLNSISLNLISNNPPIFDISRTPYVTTAIPNGGFIQKEDDSTSIEHFVFC